MQFLYTYILFSSKILVHSGFCANRSKSHVSSGLTCAKPVTLIRSLYGNCRALRIDIVKVGGNEFHV